MMSPPLITATSPKSNCRCRQQSPRLTPGSLNLPTRPTHSRIYHNPGQGWRLNPIRLLRRVRRNSNGLTGMAFRIRSSGRHTHLRPTDFSASGHERRRHCRVVLDARRLSQGDMDAAGRLLHAGSKGSLFALSLLQAHMAGAPTGNPVMGYALGRVMEMKGDSRISMARDGTFRAPISAEQRILGERMALEIFSQPKEASPQAGAVDPRPIPLLME